MKKLTTREWVFKELKARPWDTHASIADTVGVSRERVRQIARDIPGESAKERLKKRWNNKLNKEVQRVMDWRPPEDHRIYLPWMAAENSGIKCSPGRASGANWTIRPSSYWFYGNGYRLSIRYCLTQARPSPRALTRYHRFCVADKGSDFYVLIANDGTTFVVPGWFIKDIKRHLYINAAPRSEPYNNICPKVDYWQFKDAWHLISKEKE